MAHTSPFLEGMLYQELDSIMVFGMGTSSISPEKTLPIDQLSNNGAFHKILIGETLDYKLNELAVLTAVEVVFFQIQAMMRPMRLDTDDFDTLMHNLPISGFWAFPIYNFGDSAHITDIKILNVQPPPPTWLKEPHIRVANGYAKFTIP